MSTTKQWYDVNEPVEFGLRISLDDCLEFSEQRFDDVAADKKGPLSDCESALNLEMSVDPG